MPVPRAGGSSNGVRIWRAPDAERVIAATRAWARRSKAEDPRLLRVGLFGSYATGRHGPGSDLDLLLIVADSDEPRWFMRGAGYDTAELPLEADLFVYTRDELERMRERPGMRRILAETIWLA